MNSSTASTTMPARLESVFFELLSELNACGHQAATLLERTRLPGWSRRSLFYFLGYVARADGRVTETDIRFAESLMKALRLSDRQRKAAIEHFREGKQDDSLIRARGMRLRMTRRMMPRPAIQIVLCLCHAAQLHGVPSKARRYRCEDAIERTGLPVDLMDIILDSYAQKVWITQPELRPAPTSFDQACKLLGADRNSTFDELKHAYRRRVSECHPDKLGTGLSEKEYALAKERLHRYQMAWELIKRRERVRSS